MWRGRTIREMFSGEIPGSACARYEMLLEDYLQGALGGAATEEVETHVESCVACREALEAARLGSVLVRESIAPAAEQPGGAFATRVLARIREAEGQQTQFWRPLEVLASRVAVTATVLLLVLSAYLFEFRPRTTQSAQTAISENFPELGGQPPQDEILPALAGNGNGH